VPDYCESIGGSTEFEEIVDVDLRMSSPDTYELIVKVQLWNPMGCTAGDPNGCLEYAMHPERVSAWIDWNKDGDWEDTVDGESEWVIQNEPESYLGSWSQMAWTQSGSTPISAYGWVGVRVALGWDYEPINPCEYQWVWGDVEDGMWDLGAAGAVDDIDIRVWGQDTPRENPETGQVMLYEAHILAEPGNVVERCVWGTERLLSQANGQTLAQPLLDGHGDPVPNGFRCTLQFGEDDDGYPLGQQTELGAPPVREVEVRRPYLRAPKFVFGDPTYGDKQATLAVHMRDPQGTDLAPAEFVKPYQLFFTKDGVDTIESRNPEDVPPNWWVLWPEDNATPQLNGQFDDAMLQAGRSGDYFDPWFYLVGDVRVEYGGHGCAGATWGYYTEGFDTITLCDYASYGHPGFPAPGDDVPDCPELAQPVTWGIDTLAQVLRHEMTHAFVNRNLPPGHEDGDGDHLSDDYELLTTGGFPGWGAWYRFATDPGNPDTCNLAAHKAPGYADHGDEEADAMMSQENESGAAANDWANPGAQAGQGEGGGALLSEPTDTLYSLTRRPFATSPRHLSLESIRPGALTPLSLETGFTGAYDDRGADTDSNGLFDSLEIDVGVEMSTAEEVAVVVDIEDTADNRFDAATVVALPTGQHTVTVRFDGVPLRRSGVSGPYHVSRVELRGEESVLHDSAEDVHDTTTYAYTDFQRPDIALADQFTEVLDDANGNGLIDALLVQTLFDVDSPGTYLVEAELDDAEGRTIARSSVRDTLQQGSQWVDLSFDGRPIFWSRQDAPYNVGRLRVRKDDVSWVHVTNVYTTTAGLTAGMFEHPEMTAEVLGDSPVTLMPMTAVDGYEYLRVDIDITAWEGDPSNPSDAPLFGYGYDTGILLDATLKDSEGNAIEVLSGDLAEIFEIDGAGATSPVDEALHFYGGRIREHGVDGPYGVDLVLSMADGAVLDQHHDAWVTAPYSATDFTRPLVALTGEYLEEPLDIDSDGLFEQLDVRVGITLTTPGQIVVHGRLVDVEGRDVAWYNSDRESSGVSHTHPGGAYDGSGYATLSFPGATIAQGQHSGPYTLRDLRVFHKNDVDKAARVDVAYTTATYAWHDFDPNG
jgi:hypothetical protein